MDKITRRKCLEKLKEDWLILLALPAAIAAMTLAVRHSVQKSLKEEKRDEQTPR